MVAPVLIVEDDVDVREILADLLESEGIPVRLAVNGQEGLASLRSALPLPGVILLDVMMPVMDGPTFLRELAADPALARVPVIVMSAAHRPELRLPPGTEILRKPLQLDDLLARIRGLGPA